WRTTLRAALPSGWRDRAGRGGSHGVRRAAGGRDSHRDRRGRCREPVLVRGAIRGAPEPGGGAGSGGRHNGAWRRGSLVVGESRPASRLAAVHAHGTIAKERRVRV